MTSVGADTTSAHRGARLAFDPKSPPLREGDRVGEKYDVIRLLGSGAMTFVVEARIVGRDEVVALQFLRPEYLVNQDLAQHFALDADAVSKIENEHVAAILEVGAMPDGEPFVVREYLDGKDLGALVREEGTAPVPCACEFLLQACEGLAAAHALGIVHRDIKPENLFLARSSQGLDVIKLLDFGISGVTLTGSPLYVSPEQIRASTELDARTDIWSLGCVLYHLLTGHAPFDAPSITLLTASILERSSPSLRERRPDVPEELEVVVSRCLAKDPNRRFQTVSELAAALYPFAPRRAQLSVEHCSHILRHAGMIPIPLVQSTIPPPSRVPTDLTATLQMAPESKARRSDEPTHADVPLPAPAPARRLKASIWVAICALVAAGAFVLRPHFDAMLAGATSAVQETSPPAMPVAAPRTAQTASPALTTADVGGAPTSSEVDALDSQTPPMGSAAPKPKSRKSHKANSQTSASQEVDVGF